MTISMGSRTRHLVTGGEPDAPFGRVAFDGDFAADPRLAKIADALIERYDVKLGALGQLQMVYLWKKKGGARNGAATIGACQRPTGLLGHFADCHFVIWLAADHVWQYEMTAYQVEALMFHELLHAAVDEEGKTGLYPHDFEGFRAEIEEYGFWKEDIKKIAESVQARLFDEDHSA